MNQEECSLGQQHQCLHPSELLQQSPHRLGDLQTTEIYSSPFQKPEVQDQGTGRFCLVRTHFLVYGYSLLSISSHGRRGKGTLWVSFIRALIPTMRCPPPLGGGSAPGCPPPNTITLWGDGVAQDQTREPGLRPGFCSLQLWDVFGAMFHAPQEARK